MSRLEQGYLEHWDDDYWHCSVCGVRLLSDEFTEEEAYADTDVCPHCKAKIYYAFTPNSTPNFTPDRYGQIRTDTYGDVRLRKADYQEAY